MHADLPVPALDPAPIPGPPALFHVLWVATFLLHLLFVNAVLGGSLLTAAACWLGPRYRRAAVFFPAMNSWAISLAITFGIAPLLFLQVLQGRFFYTATILVGWGWMSMLGLLTAAYYLNYAVKHRLAGGGNPRLLASVEALFFLGVAAIQVAVHLVQVQPASWAAASRDPWSVLYDTTFAPRLLHFVLAALSVAGLALARWTLKRRDAGDAEADLGPPARMGVAVALWATALQLLDGVWLLLALPAPVMKGLMRGGAATMVPLTVSILAGIGILVVLSRIRNPLSEGRLVRHALEMVLAAVLLMVVTRHQVRSLYLAAYGVADAPAVVPQWGAFALFLGALVLCLALTGIAVARSLKDRPGPGEDAA